ncbi:homoserine kinase [Gonapodya prolifera JEL478]|uniref:Homoserine kinase n=1 Tax=Gonapodya prolifera (strain JEL478) TaxID=1344416 RepID=A0A139AUY6_GONPJ|nr:homoserine kinase [Gonapodya prolifera JEL478]|eukprot:KXS20550.1 homoserine kinase [Gonapodya prolifera JEL478]
MSSPSPPAASSPSSSTIRRIAIKVPCSTSNLGPGFDVLGIALSLFLKVSASLQTTPPPPPDAPITITYTGDLPHTVPLEVDRNLITKVALYVAVANNASLPPGLQIHIDNPIPLGRGLGSSGAAVVAGALLANAACGLNLSRERLLDYCLAIEGHPDNVTASLMGGFCAGYLRHNIEDVVPDNLEQLVVQAWRRKRQNSQSHIQGLPLSSTSPSSSDAQSSSKSIENGTSPSPVPTQLPLNPPHNLGTHIRLPISPDVRPIACIPAFEVSTKLARKVLPTSYSRPDVVFNLQRLAVLVHALGATPPSPQTVSECMHDRVHQHYRQHLVPGLPEILALTPETTPGLLGICQSGAGPTVLAFAAPDAGERVGEAVCAIWRRQKAPEKGAPDGIECRWISLEVVEEPAECRVWEEVVGGDAEKR